MKTLTLYQPWASLIAYGVKTIETRSWAPPQGLVGQRIAIHAGKRVERDSLNFGTCKAIEKIYGPEWWRDIPVGVVLCTAVLTEAWRVVSFSGGYFQTRFSVLGKEDQRARIDPYGDFGWGRWLWFLHDVIPYSSPITAVGRMGLWDWYP